jgi:hydroxyacylglutathione hydrolase
MIDFSPAPVAGSLEVRWIHGSASRTSVTDPPIQVHGYDAHTMILRQSKATSYEAPFLYLLFGNDRALLLDTGATKDPARFPLRATVDALVTSWLAVNRRDGYELVVAHTHGHGDHVAGDAQFLDRPLTTVVGTDLEAVRSFFGFTAWPDQVVTLDLGGRILELTGIPGHHPTSLAMFDPWTGFLLTGDTVYPGRLYAPDMPTFVASMDRLVDFADARPVTHVMGCHIEMSRTPGRDYPVGIGNPDSRSDSPGTIGRCGLSSTSSPAPSSVSSSAVANKAKTEPRTSRSSFSATSSGYCSGRPAHRGCGRSTGSCSRRRVRSSRVTAGSPSG